MAKPYLLTKQRVPNWVRLSAVTLGHFSPWREAGLFCYERLLETAVKKLSRSLPLTEIFVRGSGHGKPLHPGLSDLDLVLVGKDADVPETARNILEARQLVAEIRRGWHPLGECSWIQESEREAIFALSKRDADFLGGHSYRDGAWHKRVVKSSLCFRGFEDAFERYLHGFRLWQEGLTKRAPHLLNLAHVRKIWCSTLTYLNQVGIESPPASDFLRHPPNWDTLGKLNVACLKGMESASSLFSAETESEVAPLPDAREMDWFAAHQKYLCRRYTQNVASHLALQLDARFPICFVVEPRELEGAKVSHFLQFMLNETSALKHLFLFPLLTPALASLLLTRLVPKNRNRRFLAGNTEHFSQLPVTDWEGLAWNGLTQIASLFIERPSGIELRRYRHLLTRLQVGLGQQNERLEPQITTLLTAQTRVLNQLTN